MNIGRHFRWLALGLTSLTSGWLLYKAAFPAAFLVASLVCAIVFSLFGANLKVQRKALTCVQAVLGCQVASSLSATILVTLCDNWLVIVLTVLAATLAGSAVGWFLVRCQVLPGTTAAWGTSPGGAAAMVAMATEYGADIRVVAFMQYTRVMLVTLAAPAVAHFLGENNHALGGTPLGLQDLLQFGSGQSLLTALLIAATGVYLGKKLQLPAGALLTTMLLGAALQTTGVVHFAIPSWLRVASFVALGWFIGLSFDRRGLVHVFGVLPKLLLSTLFLLGLCAFSGWVMTHTLGVDPLTAYLATSPGGLDAIVIVAMSSDVDLPLVLASQILRLFTVILTGASIAKLICRYAPPLSVKTASSVLNDNVTDKPAAV